LRFKLLIFFVLFGLVLLPAQDQIAYFKYFRTDRDFIADNSMKTTARIGIAHLEVAYDEDHQPLLISKYSRLGIVQSYEIHSYDNYKRLIRRAGLDSAKSVVKVVWYSETEPWSKAFRDYAVSEDQHLTFQGQNSIFTFAPNGRIETVTFRTVNGFDYGRIRFRYDDRDRLIVESWISLPDFKIVRKYAYEWMGQSKVLHLREYNRNNELVSHVTLEQAPADQLYKVPPPRTGNILDEVELILDEITAKKTYLPFPALIPKTEWDRLVLKTGTVMEVHFIELTGRVVRFRQAGESDDLSIPLEQVQLIISRYGERVYP